VVFLVLTVVGVFYVFFIKDPMIYRFYGYDPSIVREYTPESFLAVERTARARIICLLLVFGITMGCFLLSCLAVVRQIHFNYFLVRIGLVISLLLSLLYAILFILGASIPSRIA